MPADLTREEIARLPDVLAEMESRLHFGGDPEDDRPATEVWSELWFCDADYMVVFKAARSTLSEPARITALEAENAALREGLKDTTAHLVAAHSLLSRTPRAQMAAPSKTMFDMMLRDYEASCERARAILRGGPDAG